MSKGPISVAISWIGATPLRMWVTVSALVLLPVAWMVLHSSSFQECFSANQYYQASGPHNYNIGTAFWVRWWCVGIFIDRNGGAITALATVALTISTIGLWWVTERTLRHAHNDSVATHRPHLRVQRIDHLVFTIGQPITGQVEAVNIGVTEAIVTQIGIDLFFRDPANRKAAGFHAVPQPYGPVTIAPGMAAQILFRNGRALTASDQAGFCAGTNEMCVLGILNYNDRNNAGRSTSFFRIYRSEGNRFFPAPDDPWQGDREYEN